MILRQLDTVTDHEPVPLLTSADRIVRATAVVARNLSNGSTTVFVCGTPIAKKDKSFLKMSTGNEPATPAFNKGINTTVIKGKTYFTNWSPDVKVEGLNVDRHMDPTTHNHG